MVYNEQGLYSKAIEDLDVTLSLNPELVGAYCERGYSLFYLKQYEKSLSDLNKYIELNTKNYVANKYRRLSCYNMGDFNNAVIDLHKAIYLSPMLSFELSDKINSANEKLQYVSASRKK